MDTQLVSHCPHCRSAVRVRESHIGQPVRCPKCREQFAVSSIESPISAGASLAAAPAALETLAKSGSAPTVPESLLPPPAAKDRARLGRLGRFELSRLLGQGAFGRVYQAYDPQLERYIALKVPIFGPGDQKKIQRFLAEAKAAARLRHPNIVPTYERGQIDGRYFIAAQFVAGQTLSQRLKDAPIDFRQAAEWVRQLAEALAYAHFQGIIHRDIKPDNIMIDEKGMPQIMDFGLAKRVGEDAAMTIDGSILGTPAYMAPEQARGNQVHVGPHSDQYSLGVVLYELLTGERPFTGPTHAVIEQLLGKEPPAPRSLRREIPPDLEAICQKAMTKEISGRYASAAELAGDLACFLRGDATLARPISLLERAARWGRRNPVVASLSGALGLVVLVGITGVSIALMKVESARQDAEKERQSAENSLYFARIHLTRHYWDNGVVSQTRDLLDMATQHSQGLDLRNWEWYWLRTACSQQQYTAIGHEGAVLTVAGEPDGPLVASGGSDGTVRLWSSLTGEPVHAFDGHQGTVRAVVWHPQGRYLCSAGDDGTVRIWDALLEKCVIECSLKSEQVLCVCWSPDGNRFLAGGTGMQVRMWNFEERTTVPERTLHKVAYPIRSLAWSEQNDVLLAGHGGERVGPQVDLAVWDTNTWKKTRVGDYDLILQYPIRSLSLNQGQDRLAVTAEHSRIRILKTTDFQEVDSFADTAVVQCVAWNNSATGSRLAFSGNSQIICIYDARSNRIVGKLWGHKGTVNSLAWLANDRIVSAGDDGTICFWDASDFDESTSRRQMSNYVSSLSWSPDCKWIAIAKLESEAVLWDTENGHPDVTLKGHTSRIWSIAWHPSGSWVATKSMDKTVRVWDVVTGRQVWTAKSKLEGGQLLAWSPDGSRLAVDTGGEITVWEFDAATGKGGKVLIAHVCAPYWGLNKFAWHPNSQQLASPLLDNGRVYLDIWNVATGETITSFDTGTVECRTVSWSPDGSRIAWGDAQGILSMWNMAGTEPEFKLHAHDDEVAAICWSPDGQRLATAGWEGTVKIRSSQTGEVMLLFRHDQGRMQALAWSSNGKKLAAGNWSHRHNYVRIWDATLGYILAADIEPEATINEKADSKRSSVKADPAPPAAKAPSSKGRTNGSRNNEVELLKQRSPC